MVKDKYDLILVGTSFASSFFLKKFLEHAPESAKVLAIERGRFFSHSDRLKVKRGEVPAPAGQDTYIGSPEKPWTFDPNFGGSSNCWAGCTPRFMPNDFKMKSKYGIGMDWPLSYEDIDDYYYEVEDIMSISGPEVTPFPRKKAYPLPSHVLSSVDRIMQKHYGELYISQPAARASQAIGNRGACCSSIVCDVCPVNSKFTIENTLKYLYEDPRVTLIENSQAYALKIENNVAKSVMVRQAGKDLEFHSESIALGANPIFNSHILLNSGDTLGWTGAGISDQVGTYAKVYLNGLENVGGSSLITANGYMFYDTPDRSKYAGCLIESSQSFWSPYIRNEFGKWRQIALFKFIFEDLPQKQNRVSVSEDLMKPNITFKGISDYAQEGVKNLQSNVNKYFSVLPIERIEYDGYNQASEYHICGTTRMSLTADEGVVDKSLVHHKYRNVLVLGSGTFPTITPANPTLTLSALSLMSATKYFGS
ncbi:MAG: GMC oxidoreductase [Chryseolinea sp.]